MLTHKTSSRSRCSNILLRVSALHYSAGDQVAGGFRTVASAHVLCQPTSCGSEYFYNQCPRVRNLIGTESRLIEVSVGLRRKQAKSNSVDRFQNTEVFSDRPGFRNMKADYFWYMEIESQGYSQGAGIGLRESDGCRK